MGLLPQKHWAMSIISGESLFLSRGLQSGAHLYGLGSCEATAVGVDTCLLSAGPLHQVLPVNQPQIGHGV